MKLADTQYDNSETGCCALLNVELWDEKEITWKEKTFIQDHILAIAHIPLNYGSVIGRVHKKIEDAEAYPADPLWLTDEKSAWGSDLLVEVERDVPGATIRKLSGTFLTRVFEGPYRDAGKWCAQMQQYVRAQGKEPEKTYSYYTSCPKCAKHFGKNYTVLFAKVG